MKITPILLLCLGLVPLHAQKSDPQSKDLVAGLWSCSGKVSLLFNQSAFSQWASGGGNNVSIVTFDYEVHYKENDFSCDTKSSESYVLSCIQGGKLLKKTNNCLEINFLLGKEFSDTWSNSTILNFKSQLTSDFQFGTYEEAEQTCSLQTHFFSPAYLQFGVGLYRRKLANI